MAPDQSDIESNNPEYSQLAALIAQGIAEAAMSLARQIVQESSQVASLTVATAEKIAADKLSNGE